MRALSGDFARVIRASRALAGVEATVRYNGQPALTLDGVFLAAMAPPTPAEPASLVVRCDPDDRVPLLEDAPATYYVDGEHVRHPVVLVRLAAIDDDTLREVLTMSWRLTVPKTRRRARTRA